VIGSVQSIHGLIALSSPGEAEPGEAESAFLESLEITEKGHLEGNPNIASIRCGLEVARAAEGKAWDHERLEQSVRSCEHWGLMSRELLAKAKALLAGARVAK
jgi:hypothetical protein